MAGPGVSDLNPQRLPGRRQRRPISWNILLPRQPEQGTFRVALVIPQCLGGETNWHLMESKEVSADCAVARRDQLQGFIESLGDLAKRCRPVPPGLLGKLHGRGDDGDCVGERGFDQDRGLVIGIVTIMPEMDGDGGKYILCHFGNMSM